MLISFRSGAILSAVADTGTNLALSARASAFEFQPGLPAEWANDGTMDTRWSAIPGHNVGGWYELNWDRPVRVGQVVVFQYDRYVKEMDVQVWDDDAKTWATVQHFGQPDQRLPKVVVCRFNPRPTTRLRLANITNGPSFNEVQVFEEPFAIAPAVNLASDANGNFIGMISDAWGSEPVKGARVRLSGQAKGGAWQVATQSDEHGLFTVPMALGTTGQVAVSAEIAQSGALVEHIEQFDAAGFQYGLTPLPRKSQKTSLAGQWQFATDPPTNFWEPGWDDRRWAEIKVPAHFEMEGFRSLTGIGGYRKHFKAPRGSGRLKLRFDGVYSGAELWINGHRLASHEGGALPFEVDVTDAVHGGQNLLAVRVTEHTPVSDLLDKMSEYADFALAGIYRDVYLFRVPPAHVAALQCATVFDAAFRDATITGRAAIPPRSTGELEIVPPRPLHSGEALALQFLDGQGRVVDAFRLPFGEARVEVPPHRKPAPRPLQIFQESILAGRSTHVVGRDFELAFDQASGALRRAIGFGEVLLLELPALHVLPSGSPLSPLPNRSSWRLRRLTVEPDNDNVRVGAEGSYDHFEGGYDLRITPTGEITARSSFRYTGAKFLAREIGWVLALPQECERLRWSREAEWRVYPDDHIGRPEGETRAFADHPARLPPRWSWSQDNSPLGCNDFRSTKRRIHWCSLGYADDAVGEVAGCLCHRDRHLLHIIR